MAQNYLPDVFDTVKEIVNVDKGHVFNRTFLFSKKSAQRLEAQKELLQFAAACNKEISLAQIQAEKEVRLLELNLLYETQKLKYATLCQLVDVSNPDDLSRIGDTIARL